MKGSPKALAVLSFPNQMPDTNNLSNFENRGKEAVMAVKILIKRKIKNGNMRAASRLLINNRSEVMKQPGYISSETMRSLDDSNQIVVVSMWQNRESWEKWKKSEIRMANETEFKDYLSGQTTYEHYSLGLFQD
jgi:heme-degrading monooxygenase HmoA